MTPTKSQLREQAKQRRSQRSAVRPTRELLDYLLSKYAPGSQIGCYLNQNAEIETDDLILELQKTYSVYAPAVVAKSLNWILVTGEYQLGSFGIQEPIAAAEIKVTEFDCILLPALAVDLTGNRVGFGAGYFDRNLINAKAEKIVLVFEADIVNHVIAEDHDIKMDLIVTENRLIKINN